VNRKDYASTDARRYTTDKLIAMKIFPIDPTPYVFVYLFFVFLIPWSIFAFWAIKHMIYLLRSYPEFAAFMTPKNLKEIKHIRKHDPQLMGLYRKTMRWLFTTLTCWILGFAVLGVTLFLLDRNNLLINYSKGIFR
jgi:hypothetical protein